MSGSTEPLILFFQAFFGFFDGFILVCQKFLNEFVFDFGITTNNAFFDFYITGYDTCFNLFVPIGDGFGNLMRNIRNSGFR